jgi:PleD family two-component response regulator
VDPFKQINDRYGHATGDRCLVALGAWIDRADQAMYRAKVGGRDRVVLSEEEPAAKAA